MIAICLVMAATKLFSPIWMAIPGFFAIRGTVAHFRLMRYRCPRCSSFVAIKKMKVPLLGTMYVRNPYVASCLNCGLPLLRRSGSNEDHGTAGSPPGPSS